MSPEFFSNLLYLAVRVEEDVRLALQDRGLGRDADARIVAVNPRADDRIVAVRDIVARVDAAALVHNDSDKIVEEILWPGRRNSDTGLLERLRGRRRRAARPQVQRHGKVDVGLDLLAARPQPAEALEVEAQNTR